MAEWLAATLGVVPVIAPLDGHRQSVTELSKDKAGLRAEGNDDLPRLQDLAVFCRQ
jgi:hypothetical protein